MMCESERWRWVVGYEGLYQVSDLGRVRSVDRVVPHARFGTYNLKGRILRTNPLDRIGHLGLGLCKRGFEQKVYVHQLVAAAWIGPCPDSQQVRHGSNGKLNNSVSNLCYGTRSEDGLDKRRDGTHTGRPVRRSDGKEFISITVAAEETGYGYTGISKVCRGKQVTTGGFGWEYI